MVMVVKIPHLPYLQYSIGDENGGNDGGGYDGNSV